MVIPRQWNRLESLSYLFQRIVILHSSKDEKDFFIKKAGYPKRLQFRLSGKLNFSSSF